jgi:nucleoside-diphosphate-sugar epimerase
MEKRDFNIITNSSVNWLMYRDSTVLITGATGRLGRYILDTLVDIDLKYNLNMKVIGLARNKEKVAEVFGNILDFPNVEFLFQDVNTEINYNDKIDFIFHTAGPAAPKDYDTPVDTMWSHINGTHNVLECARTHSTKRVFYVSTVEIYGDWKQDDLIKETDMGIMQHLNSRACYPEAKRLCETMLTTYKQQYGISYCGVRLCHTIGPGISLKDGRGFAEFIDCALNDDDIVLHSSGNAMRTYTYVSDVINAAFLIMDKGNDEMYNVANIDNLISIRDLCNLIVSLVPNTKTKVVFSNEAAKLQYLPYKLAIMNVDKIKELGWKPVVNINNLFKWTIESFK